MSCWIARWRRSPAVIARPRRPLQGRRSTRRSAARVHPLRQANFRLGQLWTRQQRHRHKAFRLTAYHANLPHPGLHQTRAHSACSSFKKQSATVNLWVPKPFRAIGLSVMPKLVAIARDGMSTRITDRVRTPGPVSVGNKISALTGANHVCCANQTRVVRTNDVAELYRTLQVGNGKADEAFLPVAPATVGIPR
jgi:hypothetical protein